MPAFVAAIAAFFGISQLRLIVYSGLVVAALAGGLVVRQHYINLGWDKAMAAVKKQDDRALSAAKKAQDRADRCSADSFWDVLTQSCKVGDDQ